MFRLRRGALVVGVLSFGLISGCLSIHRPFFGRHGCPETECCDIGAVPDVAVPFGGSCCPAPGGVGNPALLPPPNLAPQNVPPQLTAPPSGDRIVPIPRSPTSPYNP